MGTKQQWPRKMKVTVILCTYNRCRVLETALASVAASEMPATVDWDVLVVDNNSSDQTREVVDEYIRKFPAAFITFLNRVKENPMPLIAASAKPAAKFSHFSMTM
jgi:glycosyltransferase involved in cell wall biosynthesis